MRRVLKRVAVLLLAVVPVAAWGLATALPGAADVVVALVHGITVLKGCDASTEIGTPYMCSVSIRNNVDEQHDTLTITGLTDTIATAGGNLQSSTAFPGGLLPQLTLTLTGGATCNVGQ